MLWLSPVWDFADLFRQVWPLWLFQSAVVIAFLIGLRRWKHSLIAIALGLLIALSGASELWRQQGTPYSLTIPSGAVPLRVATHNLWSENFAPERTIDVLQGLDADIIGLQEAFGNSRGIEAALMETHPWRAACDHHSTRLVSRLEILDSGCLEWRDTDWPESRIALWRWEVPRTVWARIRLEDGSTFVAVSTHLTWPNPLSVQTEQRRNLADLLRRFEGESLVLLGDFNAAAPSAALSRIEHDTGLERQTFGIASWPSSRAAGRRIGVRLPEVPGLVGIDHVFTSAEWTALDGRPGALTGSDHRPVVVTLFRLDEPD
jgi:endonuclease/exonuclease/phosphatase (EEP) superfamily protein YafD